MAVIAGIPPEALKRVLERNGYRAIDEDELNWLMVKEGVDEPMVVPKKGRVLGVDIMAKAHGLARQGKFSNDLLGEVSAHTHRPDTADADDEADSTPTPP